MLITFYKNSSDDRVINKGLEEIGSLDIKFKSNSSIINPKIVIEKDLEEKFLTCNYAYIPKFNRYYYIKDFEVFPSKIYTLTLAVDVLESFKTDILNSNGYISKQTDYNKFYDSEYESEVKKEIDVFKSNVKLDLNIRNDVLITIGAIN